MGHNGPGCQRGKGFRSFGASIPLINGTGGAMIMYGGANNVQQSLVFRDPFAELSVPKVFGLSSIVRPARYSSGLVRVRVGWRLGSRGLWNLSVPLQAHRWK